MKLALWLQRAGLNHGNRATLKLGSRVARCYSEVAETVARLAGALRQRVGLKTRRRERHLPDPRYYFNVHTRSCAA
jgi:hypothetical protein